jgi:hypothetical protein
MNQSMLRVTLFTFLLIAVGSQSVAQSETDVEFWEKSIPRWIGLKKIASASTSFTGELVFDSDLEELTELTEKLLKASKLELNGIYDSVSTSQSKFMGKREKRSVIRFVCKKGDTTTVCFLHVSLLTYETERLLIRWDLATL